MSPSTRRREWSWYDHTGAIYHRLEATFAELGALARQRKVAVIGLPLLWNDPAKQVHLATLEELTARNQVPYLNLWERLRTTDLESLSSRDMPRDHIHYTPAMHALVADTLADAVAPVVAADRWPPRF